MKKKVVGLVEKVELIGEKNVKTYALFDTGASSTSIDIQLASKAKLGPVIRTTSVKNPSLKGKTRRPVVWSKIRIRGGIFETNVNLQDRSHMTFPIIIGRDVLVGNFIIDPKKNLDVFKRMNARQMKGQKLLNDFG